MSRVKELIRRIKSENSLLGDQDLLLLRGKIIAIDETERTATIETQEGIEVKQVMMSTLLNTESSVYIVPKVGSECIAIFESNSNESYVIATEEVDHIDVAIGEMRAKIDSELARVEIGMMSAELSREGIVLNGGHYGGLVKVEALTGRLNAIERDINELKRAMGGWTPAPQDGGAALKGAIATWVGAELRETERGDYENEQVKQ